MSETMCEVRARQATVADGGRGGPAVGVSTRLALVAMFVVGLALHSGPRAESAADPAADQVVAVERAFARTMAERDLDAFAGFLSEEAIFFAGTQPLRGKAAVIEAWSRYYDGPEPPFSWEPDQVEVLDSGKLALSTGPVRDPGGKVIARFQSIWRLEAPGVWRIVFDKGGPPSPGPVSPEPSDTAPADTSSEAAKQER